MKNQAETRTADKPGLLDFHLMKFQEDGWPQELLDKAGRIFTVCLYDASECTHCCEITPSHWLVPLYHTTEKPIPEEVQDQIDEADLEPFYVHCQDCRSDFHIGNPLKDEDRNKSWKELSMSYDDVMEGLREYEACNWRF
jgi:hypothetical protein